MRFLTNKSFNFERESGPPSEIHDYDNTHNHTLIMTAQIHSCNTCISELLTGITPIQYNYMMTHSTYNQRSWYSFNPSHALLLQIHAIRVNQHQSDSRLYIAITMQSYGWDYCYSNPSSRNISNYQFIMMTHIKIQNNRLCVTCSITLTYMYINPQACTLLSYIDEHNPHSSLVCHTLYFYSSRVG